MTEQTLDPRATSELERPRRALMTVDFVTVFSVEQCRQWLDYAADQRDTQRVELWDDDSFTILCCPEPDDPYDDAAARPFEVRFWGTLEAHEHGTWVWGTSIEQPGAERRRFGLPPTIVVVVLVTLVLEAFFRGAQTTMLIWVAGLAVIGAWALMKWWQHHRDALRVILWIWETLYVKPPKHDQDDDKDQGDGDDPDTQA